METHPLIGLVRPPYALLVRVASAFRCPFLLLLRLYWGWQFTQTGWGKLHNHEGVTKFFTELHIPLPGANAWLVGTVELLGGICLIAGFATRLAALPLTMTLIVAYLTDSIDTIKNFLQNSDPFFQATPFPFLFACLVLLIFGPGAISLDHLLRKKFGAPASETKASPA
jgi:putative oxidoreductase